MKIAIIGSNSFLARSIKKIASDYQVICFGRQAEHLFEFPTNGVEKIEKGLLIDSDVIVYCAGAGIQPSHSDTNEHIFALNYEQPKLLIERLIQNDYNGQLITFGSYFEIGDSIKRTPFSEAELINSKNPIPNAYCESKRKLTQLINQQHSQVSFNHLHLILTNIYGVGENENRLFPYLARSFKSGEEVQLTSGKQIRQFTHVDDVSKFILHHRTKSLSGILNFTNPKQESVRNAVEQFAELAKFPNQNLNFESISRRDSQMNFLALDIEKLLRVVPNFKFVSLKDGLTQYLSLSFLLLNLAYTF